MHRQLLLQLFLCGFFVTQTESLLGSPFMNEPEVDESNSPDSPQEMEATSVSQSARNNVGSTKWGLGKSWNGDSYYQNKWKCNLFVHDVLREVNAVTPTRWSWSQFRRAPIGANEWANPDSWFVKNTNCYETVQYSRRQSGDIIAFKRRNGNSGHVGIVSSNGNFISALRSRVQEDNVDLFRRNDENIVRTTVWRYTC